MTVIKKEGIWGQNAEDKKCHLAALADLGLDLAVDASTWASCFSRSARWGQEVQVHLMISIFEDRFRKTFHTFNDILLHLAYFHCQELVSLSLQEGCAFRQFLRINLEF